MGKAEVFLDLQETGGQSSQRKSSQLQRATTDPFLNFLSSEPNFWSLLLVGSHLPLGLLKLSLPLCFFSGTCVPDKASLLDWMEQDQPEQTFSG